MKFQKPNQKSVTNAAITAGSFVAGAKVGDGLSAVMPASVASYKRWLIGIGGIALAACVPTNTTSGAALHSGLIGLGAKQLYDEISDTLADAIPIKVAEANATLSVTDKFINAIVGHGTEEAIKVPAAPPIGDLPKGNLAPWLGSPFLGEPEDMWDRPIEQEAVPLLGV